MRAAHDIDALSVSGITYAARSDATAQAELSALAVCYRFILDRANERGRLLDKGGPDDEKGRSSSDSLATTDCTG